MKILSFLFTIFATLGVSASVLDRSSFVFDGSTAFNVVIDETLFNYQQENDLFLQFEKQNSGTQQSLANFCEAKVDITIAQRPLTPREAERCEDNDVYYIELPIGYDVGRFFVASDSDLPTRMVTEELLWIWSIVLSGGKLDWSEIDPTVTGEVVFLGPQSESEVLNIMAGAQASTGLADIVITDFTDYEQVVERTLSQPGAIAMVPSLYNAGLFSQMTKVELTSDEDIDQFLRIDPDNVSFRIPVILYINEDSLRKAHVTEAMRFMVERIGLIADSVGIQQLDPELFRQVIASFVAYLDANADTPTLETLGFAN